MYNLDHLVYWIKEREDIRFLKEKHTPPPWSSNKVMQNTYFCNVHREDDRVTKWIRGNFPEDYAWPEFNMMVARLVNKPTSLEAMGWPFHHWLFSSRYMFGKVMKEKGSWGSAYIVSTNGRAMPKHEYVQGLLTAALPALTQVGQATTLAQAHGSLQAIQGIGSFMSGQIIADLKNTPGHLLTEAQDYWTWCAHGPGSLRGMGWLLHPGKSCTPTEFYQAMPRLRGDIYDAFHDMSIDMQDLQNCLCEFDKYMRVSTGTGRSKRKYPQ